MALMTVDLGDAARLWYERGWPPFPLPANAKGPPPSGVTGYDGLDLTAAQVAAARWTGNVGVRMPADVIGLDVDGYGGKRAVSALMALEAELGPLPPTVRSSNGRPGQSGIRFYRVPVGLSWVTSLPGGIDIIQRHHRYAAVWPSMHPEGRQYVLVDELSRERCEVPEVADLPELPWAWIAFLSRLPGEEAQVPQAASPDAYKGFLEAHTSADAPGYVGAVIVGLFNTEVDAGRSRHDSMQHCLIWAMERARAGLCSAPAALAELAAAWQPRHTDPRRAEPFSITRTTEFQAMTFHAVGKALAKSDDDLAGIRIDAGVLTIAPSRVAVADLFSPEAEAQGEGDDTLTLVNWNDDQEPRKELVEGLLFAGSWTQVVAPAKAGKSTVTIWLALELSEGRDPLDGHDIVPVTVLLVNGEMGLDDLEELFDDMGTDPRRLGRFYVTDERVRLDRAGDAARLLATVRQLGVGLVLIDGLNGTINPEASENDDNTWKPFYERAIVPLKRLGVAVMSTDNMGKDASRGSRGSSVKNDKADAVVAAEPLDAGVRLRVTHGRGGRYAKSVELGVKGLDRSESIRFWRIDRGWPAGTKEAAEMLARLGVPLDAARRPAGVQVRGAGEQLSNEVLTAALRYRKANVPALRLVDNLPDRPDHSPDHSE